MPQMCPMNWLLLMIYFLFFYIIFLVYINFFFKALLKFNKKIILCKYLFKWY